MAADAVSAVPTVWQLIGVCCARSMAAARLRSDAHHDGVGGGPGLPPAASRPGLVAPLGQQRPAQRRQRQPDRHLERGHRRGDGGDRLGARPDLVGQLGVGRLQAARHQQRQEDPSTGPAHRRGRGGERAQLTGHRRGEVVRGLS